MISQWLTFTRLWAVLLGLCSALFAAQIQPVRAAELGGNKLAPFGANLFTGAFSKENFTAFSPDYRVQIGDKVNLRVWGGVSFDGALPVDPQGNVFIPNVGPVRVLGVRNGELNELVTKAAANVYKSTVNVYATLDAAQPVRIFVTGFVKNPGLYSGVSADSVLRFVDKAGGIDPDRGSFIDVTLLRGGQPRSKFNLYQFISEGRIDLIPLSDGDTIVVAARRSYVSIAGDVMNAAEFELQNGASARLSDVLSLARPKSSAVSARIARKKEGKRSAEYFPLSSAASIEVFDGDDVTITSDLETSNILVSLESGQGSRALVLPYGATLDQAISGWRRASGRESTESVQLFRQSVAKRQKEMLEVSLQKLEAISLNVPSRTSEESALRTREAELVKQFIERARSSANFKGQVVLTGDASSMRLEDGDVIKVPEKSSVVMIHGDVLFPSAVAWKQGVSVSGYVSQAGGTVRRESSDRVVIIRLSGETIPASESTEVLPGDELMVLPKVESKNLEVVRSITSIIYQLAIGARTITGL